MPDMLGSHCAAVGFVAAYALEYGIRKRAEGKCNLTKERLDERSSRQYGSDSGSSDRSSDRRVRFRDEAPKAESMYSDLFGGKMLAGVAAAGLIAYQVNNMRKKDSKKIPERQRYRSLDYGQDAEQDRRYSYNPSYDSEVIQNEDRIGGVPPMYKLRNGSEANISQGSRSQSRSQSRGQSRPRFRTPVYA